MRRLVLAINLGLIGALFAFSLAVPAIDAGGGGHGGCSQLPRDGAGQHVTIQDNCYSPAVLYIQPGESVTWANQDYYGHNVVTFDGELLGEQKPFLQGGFSGLEEGELLTYIFHEPGVVPYYCSIHPSMLGVVVVGHPTNEFGADSSLQANASSPQTESHQETQPSWAKVTGSGKGTGNDDGAPWGEVVVGLGLFGGLLVGLVAVGGGIKLHRRPR